MERVTQFLYESVIVRSILIQYILIDILSYCILEHSDVRKFERSLQQNLLNSLTSCQSGLLTLGTYWTLPL